MQLASRPYDLLLFDFDGAIVDSAPAIHHCFALALQELGETPPDFQTVKDCIGTGIADCFRSLVPNMDQADLQQAVDSYRRHYAVEAKSMAELFPGVLETLEQLHAAGLTLAIVSNKGESALFQSLREYELERFFHAVVGARPKAPRKPDPATYQRALAQLHGRKPDRPPLMIGDTEVDVRFGKAVGCACYTQYGYGNDAVCRALAPEHEVSGFWEIALVAGVR